MSSYSDLGKLRTVCLKSGKPFKFLTINVNRNNYTLIMRENPTATTPYDCQHPAFALNYLCLHTTIPQQNISMLLYLWRFQLSRLTLSLCSVLHASELHTILYLNIHLIILSTPIQVENQLIFLIRVGFRHKLAFVISM